jgi:hypothetical protein
MLQRGMFCDLLDVDIINMLQKRVFFENGDQLSHIDYSFGSSCAAAARPA